jgi:hypothetical protein
MAVVILTASSMPSWVSRFSFSRNVSPSVQGMTWYRNASASPESNGGRMCVRLQLLEEVLDDDQLTRVAYPFGRINSWNGR